MNPIVARYDRDARDYERYWAPVLADTSRRLLELVGPFVTRAGKQVRILEVGTGTGTVALAAAERWPGAHVMASDAAAGMLAVARDRAEAAGRGGDGRLEFVAGEADRLPLPDGSVDVVVSSFVLQLVPDRLAALREAHRLLRPGGLAAYVTWLDRDSREPFRPADEFDEAVLDLGIEEEEEGPPEPHAGDVPSPRAAAGELRRAGFRDVTAREDWLDYRWTRDGYLEYKLAYDERALMSALSDAQQAALGRRARERLDALADDAFRWQAPIVFATALKPLP